MDYGYNKFGEGKEGDRLRIESHKRFNNWLQKNNIIKNKIAHGSDKWSMLIPRKRYYESYRIPTGPYALFDHCALFKNIDNKRIFISQPYWNVDKNILDVKINDDETLSQWADNRGLNLRTSFEESWHYPGSTTLIEMTLIDPIKLELAIKTRYPRWKYYG